MAGLEQKEIETGIKPIDFWKLKDTIGRVNAFDSQLAKLPPEIDSDGHNVPRTFSGDVFKSTFNDKLKLVPDDISNKKWEIIGKKVVITYDDHEMWFFDYPLDNTKKKNEVEDAMVWFFVDLYLTNTNGAPKDQMQWALDKMWTFMTEKVIREQLRRNPVLIDSPQSTKTEVRQIKKETKDISSANKEQSKKLKSDLSFLHEYTEEKIMTVKELDLAFIKKFYDLYNIDLQKINDALATASESETAVLQQQKNLIHQKMQRRTAEYLINVAALNPDKNKQRIQEDLCKLLPALYNYDFEPSRINGFFEDLATMKSGGKLVIKKDWFTKNGTPERVVEEFFNIIAESKHLYGRNAPWLIEGDSGRFKKNYTIVDGRWHWKWKVLTPWATGTTRNVYREGTAKLDTSPAGTEAQSYIKTHIRYKTVWDTKQEHIITDIDLTKTPMKVLIDLYHEYSSGDHTEYSRSDLQMIQYYIVKNVITGVAQNSGPATFSQLGNGDIEQWKAIFKQCMMGTIFSKDRPLSQWLIHEINNEAYKRSAWLRATGTDAYGVSWTALDDAGNYVRGYGPGATNSANFDEIVWRSAAYAMARHFEAGTIALEVVFNPKNGVYGSDTEAADIFREIASQNGIKHELWKDRSSDGLWNTWLRGGLDIAVWKMTEAGMSKNLAEGIANGVEIAANVAEAGMTIAAVFKWAQAWFNVLKGSWNFLFGEGDKYKADFDAAWTRAKSAMGYATGSAAIGFIKDPANYLQKNVLVQAIWPMLSDTVKRQQIERKTLEDGRLRKVADTFSVVNEQLFVGYSMKQLVDAGVISKGTNWIVVDPDKLSQFFERTRSREFSNMTAQQQEDFLRDSAKAIERSLVNSYGLDLETFDAIKDDTGDFINTLSARHLRKWKLEESLKNMSRIPWLTIDKEELLKLDDTALTERLARFEAIKTLYDRLSPAGYDIWGTTTWKDFVAKFPYTDFQRDILWSTDRPWGVWSQPRSFQQYWQDKLIELADAPDKVTADEIYAAMMNVLANVSAGRDRPSSVPPSTPAASWTLVVPSTTADEPNYRDSGSAASMYVYMTENITALTPKQKNAFDTSKKDLIPDTNPQNFEWKELEN
jgi:hypothetical protein